MSTKSQRTKLAERAAQIALRSAIAAQKKLAASVEADGDVFLPRFLTIERHRRIVRAMREDHEREQREEQAANMRLFARIFGASLDDEIAPSARSTPRESLGRRIESLRADPVDDDDSPRRATAKEIIRAGRRRRGEED
jgi:hypothetical protein